MKQFRVLINGNNYLGEWSNCSDVSIEYMQRLENSLNNYYGDNWQIVYRG